MGGTTQVSKYSRIWPHSPIPTLQAPHSLRVQMGPNQPPSLPPSPSSFLLPGSGISDHQPPPSFKTIKVLEGKDLIKRSHSPSPGLSFSRCSMQVSGK